MKVRNVAAGAGAALAGYAFVVRPRHVRWGATDVALLYPGQFVMERKMLLEIKRRAEAPAAASAVAGLATIAARDGVPAVAQAG